MIVSLRKNPLSKSDRGCVRYARKLQHLFVANAHRVKEKRKRYKKTRHMPRKKSICLLTKKAQYDTITIHTVLLCLFLDFTSNMVILPQHGAAVK